MMRLPKFEHIQAQTIDEVVSLLAQHGKAAKLLAGGTDLLVNMKHKLHTPDYVISLNSIDALRQITFSDTDGLKLGSAVRWDEILEHPEVQAHYPALIQAVESVATPNLQNKGTIGGNICLDTRCYYYNQSDFWRQALGGCKKANSDYCHVAPNLGRCVAVFSSDPVSALITYGATITIAGAKGQRELQLLDLYKDDGINFLNLASDEFVVDVKLAKPADNNKVVFNKFRKRLAIDFPLANTCVSVSKNADGTVADCKIILGAVASCPIEAVAAQDHLTGKRLTEETIKETAELAFKAAKPLPNTAGTPLYRKKIARVIVKRALQELSV